MVSSYSSYASSYGSGISSVKASGIESVPPFLLVLVTLFLILLLVAWLWSISLFAQEASRKGHFKTGKLWFIGIFATPIVVGIYTAQLPDLKAGQAGEISREDKKALEAEVFPEL